MHGKPATDTPTHGDIDRLLDSREVRKALGGLSESKFRRMTRDNVLPLVRQGSRVYVRASVLNSYIANLPAA
jgi:hypothetical protein